MTLARLPPNAQPLSLTFGASGALMRSDSPSQPLMARCMKRVSGMSVRSCFLRGFAQGSRVA